MGYCGKLSAVRESVLTAVSHGGKGGVLVLENEVNIEGLSVNKNECSVASFVRIRRKKLTKLAMLHSFLFTESPSMFTSFSGTKVVYMLISDSLDLA